MINAVLIALRVYWHLPPNGQVAYKRSGYVATQTAALTVKQAACSAGRQLNACGGGILTCDLNWATCLRFFRRSPKKLHDLLDIALADCGAMLDGIFQDHDQGVAEFTGLQRQRC